MQQYDYQNEEKRFKPLKTIDCLTLAESRFARRDWLVKDLLRPGLAVLAGSPKVGKSWMMLQLCLCVAKGEDFLGMHTHQGTVLYFALEDGSSRLQDRVLRVTDEYPDNLHFAGKCPEIGEELVWQLRHFISIYPDVKLIVIDTYQKVRNDLNQPSYAKDYLETSTVKCLADTLNVTILLVHHTRKMTDSDAFNEISGTNGIAGSADTLMVLKKEKRTDRTASLTVTGRDIEDREMALRLDTETCQWIVTSAGSGNAPDDETPPILYKLANYMKRIKEYNGSNGVFFEQFSADCGESVSSKSLKQIMNRYRYKLEDMGVSFRSYRTSSMRLIWICYEDPEQPADDESQSGMTHG